MPSYNIDPKWVGEAIDSVRNQIYPDWELCISDDASTVEGLRELLEHYMAAERRIRVTFRTQNGHISANSNSALCLATGDFVALIDADDLLAEDALFWVAHEIAAHPETDMLFTDEDKIDEKGLQFDPYFKTAWNPALMLSQNAFGHLGVYRRSLVEKVGGFREGFEGSQDHDLVLRCAAQTAPDRIRHIPRILYHWRVLPDSTASNVSAKPYAWEAGRRAIVDYLKNSNINARVEAAVGIFYQVVYEAPKSLPLVSILVPTKLTNKITSRSLLSILNKSTYTNFELLLLATDKDASVAETNPMFTELLADRRVRTVTYGAKPFNYSWVCNFGAKAARADLLCFLNDDVEVITADWLERLVARVSLDGVGAAGPMLYYPSNRIQQAGVILGMGGVADHAFRTMERGKTGNFGRGGLEQDYSCVTAACLLVRRQVFEAAGAFDDTLPVAFNDVDLCIRIRRTGTRIIWTPNVEMYHHESLTFGMHDSPQRRSQFYFDVGVMLTRWKDVLDCDPYYNPNLSHKPGAAFSLAWPPRVPDAMSLAAGSESFCAISRTSSLPGILS